MGMQLAPYLDRFAQYLDVKAREEKQQKQLNFQRQNSYMAMQSLASSRTPEELTRNYQQGIAGMNLTGDYKGIEALTMANKNMQGNFDRQESDVNTALSNLSYFDKTKTYSWDGKIVTGDQMQENLRGFTPRQVEAYFKTNKDVQPEYSFDNNGVGTKVYKDQSGRIASNPIPTTDADKMMPGFIDALRKYTGWTTKRDTEAEKLRLDKERVNIAKRNSDISAGQLGVAQQKADLDKARFSMEAANGNGVRPMTAGQAYDAQDKAYSKVGTDAAGTIKDFILRYKKNLPDAGISQMTNEDILRLPDSVIYGQLGNIEKYIQWTLPKDKNPKSESSVLYNAINDMEENHKRLKKIPGQLNSQPSNKNNSKDWSQL